MIATYAAASPQYPNGWGGPIAILIPFLLLWLATTGYERWQEARQTGSPLFGQKKTLETVKPQVTADSDSDDSADQTGRAVVPVKDQQTEFIAARFNRIGKTQLAHEFAAQFKVSEATAWRALRDYGDRKGGAA